MSIFVSLFSFAIHLQSLDYIGHELWVVFIKNKAIILDELVWYYGRSMQVHTWVTVLIRYTSSKFGLDRPRIKDTLRKNRMIYSSVPGSYYRQSHSNPKTRSVLSFTTTMQDWFCSSKDYELFAQGQKYLFLSNSASNIGSCMTVDI